MPGRDKTLHQGHRKRMRERFYKSGFENFDSHELLEMLLFYSIPCADTNETAHRLIDYFGSFRNIFSGSYPEFSKIEGIGNHSALLLALMGEIIRRYHCPKPSAQNTYSYKWRRQYFLKQLGTEKKHEILMAACLDDDMKIIRSTVLETGTPGQVKFDPYKVIEFVLLSGSHSVILAHNHPLGEPKPSYEDRWETNSLRTFLKKINIELKDHIIVGQNQAYSMAEHGFLQ